MEVVEACVGEGTWFLRTVERTRRQPDNLPERYKREQLMRLEDMRNALLAFTNERLGICPQFVPPIDSKEKELQAFRISLDLWDDPSFIDGFIEAGEHSFGDDDLGVIESWKNALSGPMICMETYGDKALMLCEGYVFEAVSFGRMWDEMIVYSPDLVVTSLIPFEGMIALGGFTTRHRSPMGGSGLSRINEEFRNALKRGIVTDSQEFCAASQEVRTQRELLGLEPNSWFAYQEFITELNDRNGNACRPYDIKLGLRG